MKTINKAVLLAAGFGTRLRPLTNHRAKPALPFFDKPVLAHLLDRLATAGIEHVYINLHYNGWSVRRSLRSCRRGSLAISYSYEPAILGTAGVLAPLYSQLKDASFLMINGDILTDIDLEALIKQHQCDSEAIATVALHPPSAHLNHPLVGSDDKGRLSRFPYGPLAQGNAAWCGTFAGIHVIRPDLFRFIRKNVFQCINSQIYASALDQGFPIQTYRHDGYWNDIGTPSRYMSAHRDVLNGNLRLPGVAASITGSWYHPMASVHPDAAVGSGVIVGSGCVVGRDTFLRNVVVWPGTVIESGKRFQNGILMTGNQFLSVSGEDPE